MPNDEPTWSAPSPSQPWPPSEPSAEPSRQPSVEASTPHSRLLPNAPPAPPRQPRGPRGPRGRRWWWLAAAVVVLLVGVGVGIAVWPGSDTTPPGAGGTGYTAPASTSPRATATAPLTAVDRTVLQAVVGDCVDVRDALDDVDPPTAALTECTDPSATFSVVGFNKKSGAERPCRGDSELRSTNVDRVLCLKRVYQAGQCVLGNGAQQFLASAVGCGETPQPPFTQLFKIDAVSQQGAAAVCTPPAVAVATESNRGVCLRQVR